jgi:hypothetical protein
MVGTVNAMVIKVTGRTEEAFGAALHLNNEYILFTFHVVERKLAGLQIQELAQDHNNCLNSKLQSYFDPEANHRF